MEISVNRLVGYPLKLQICRIIGSLCNFITKYRKRTNETAVRASSFDNDIVIGGNTFVHLPRPVCVLVITSNGLSRRIRYRTHRYRYQNQILEKIRVTNIVRENRRSEITLANRIRGIGTMIRRLRYF